MATQAKKASSRLIPFSVAIPHGKWTPKPFNRREAYHVGRALLPVFTDWLHSDAAVGIYDVYTDTKWLFFYFSDENTAFAFKVRFG